MDKKELIKNTLLNFEEDLFSEIKEFFAAKDYISFSFCSMSSVSKEIFAEKLYDYFEKVEINTSKSFDKLIDKYMSNIDSIVSGKVAKAHRANKKNPHPIVPRARKYYEKADERRKEKTLENLVDFSRIMMCLYTAIIKNDKKEITDMNYSSDCLYIETIVDAMKNEQAVLGKSAKFNLKDFYDDDDFTFILLSLIYFYIKNNAAIGEY